MKSETTKLRYVSSKDPEKIVDYVNIGISYKIEIKGNPTYSKGKWYLWFNLPEETMKELPFGNLD